MVPLAEQFSSFIITVSTGIIMGITYDLYWSIRELLHLRKIGTGIGDLFFWSVSTAIAFFLLLVGNWGEVRFYVFLGIIFGIILYLQWFSAAMRKLFGGVLTIFGKFLGLLITIVLWPWQLLRRVLGIPMSVFVIIKTKTSKLLLRKKRT